MGKVGKTIVTHFNPDLDAICAVWLVKKFWPASRGEPGFDEAQVKFVPAGQTLNGEPPESNPEIIHVDTGLGRFDHHRENKPTCAAKLVLAHLKIEDEAVKRLVEVVFQWDYSVADLTYPKAADDRYNFLFNERQIIKGFRSLFPGQSQKHLEIGFLILEAIYQNLKCKIAAEKLIKKARKFKTLWGKGIAQTTRNEVFLHLSQMKGFVVAVTKDPRQGHVRIHGLPSMGVDLTATWRKLKKKDPTATWFLHPSRCLLLNGSTTNPKMKPTRLSLEEVIEVLKSKD